MNFQENLARRAIKKESLKWWRAFGVYGPRMSISEIESWELAINDWEHFAIGAGDQWEEYYQGKGYYPGKGKEYYPC
jgi:hypothetical protein